MKNSIIFIIIFIIFSINSYCLENKKLIFACEDKTGYPWIFFDNFSGKPSGFDIEFLSLLAKKLDIQIEIIPSPWKRTLEKMKEGKIDGTFSASFVADRAKYGIYPPYKDGIPSDIYSIHYSSYSIYKLKTSPVYFNKNKFINLNGLIGAQLGFSIVSDIKKMGYIVDDSTADPDSILKKLISKRVEVALIQSERADYLIKNNPSYLFNITKMDYSEFPFHKKPYYIMLSKKICTENPEFIDKIWKTLLEVKTSHEYFDLIKKYNISR